MKLKFKHQAYQANSVQAIVDCFKGQRPDEAARRYKIDPGTDAKGQIGSTVYVDEGFKNADLQLSNAQLLANIQAVQTRQNLAISSKLVSTKASPVNLDIEMETGTGKHVYFVAETKGSMASLQLKGMEEAKIECAQRFFNKLNAELASKNVTYNVVDNFKNLMNIVR